MSPADCDHSVLMFIVGASIHLYYTPPAYRLWYLHIPIQVILGFRCFVILKFVIFLQSDLNIIQYFEDIFIETIFINIKVGNIIYPIFKPGPILGLVSISWM